ncbi:MAG TPA: sensor histidine kinase, partial [Polyangium sp.]|nr:sensor histidine kinase [Polyangium sp.]
TRGAELARARTQSELDVMLSANSFDTVLCDLSPIRADIAGTLGRIREANLHARIVIISGSANPIEGLPPNGNFGYVRKPFEIQELVIEITK